MADSDISYVGAAFKKGWNLLFLAGGLAGAALTFSLPALGGVLAVEMIYLFLTSTNKNFQLKTRAKIHARRRRDEIKRRENALFQMSYSPERKRYLELRKKIETIRQNYQRQAPQAVAFQATGNLGHLQESFLKLVFSLTNFQKYMKGNSQSDLEKQISVLEKEMEGAAENVRSLKQKRVDILRQRLEKTDVARQNMEVLRNQLDMIDETVSLLLEQSFSLENIEEVNDKLDAVNRDAEVASQSMAEMDFIDLSSDFTESDILRVSRKIREM